MTPETLMEANMLAADIRHLEGFIQALSLIKSGTNIAANIAALSQDYRTLMIDYTNGDLFQVCMQAKAAAEENLARLKVRFEELK